MLTKELSRLDSHVHEVKRLLIAGGMVGKQLDFLMQEMNREANTLGSKSGYHRNHTNSDAIEKYNRANA